MEVEDVEEKKDVDDGVHNAPDKTNDTSADDNSPDDNSPNNNPSPANSSPASPASRVDVDMMDMNPPAIGMAPMDASQAALMAEAQHLANMRRSLNFGKRVNRMGFQ
jgi:hypothetical protein